MSRTFFCDYIRNGEEGIWTLAPLLTTYSLSRRAPSASWVLLHTINEKTPLKRCAIQCLPDLSWRIRRRWDSNPRYLSVSLVFKTSSLNHSDTSPYVFILFRSRKRLTYIITSICICQQLFSIFFIFLICFFNRRKVGEAAIYKMLRFAASKLLSRNLDLL